ncbi:MAG: winged helix-turn-helix domain-containing protein [Woeseiaceae bacterium]|nr:winged helix-turn-helix domain-containing protein [Woeseiaceae bacterium]
MKERTTPTYRIGDFTLEVDSNALFSADTTHQLEPLQAELLAYLARRAGEVVSLDDLLNDLWKGRYVTESSIYRQISHLRRLLGDDANEPAYIQTVRKRGYRLIADVSVPAEPPQTAVESAEGSAPQPPRRAALALGLVVIAALIAAMWPRPDEKPAEGDAAQPVIAVLPFESLSPSTPEFVADGLARSLTDRLAAIDGLRVIAYPSVRAVASEPPTSLAEQLGANLLVSGNVLSDDTEETLRVTSALLDPASGEQLWTQDTQLAADDLFGLHDEVARNIAVYLDIEVSQAAARRSRALPAEVYSALVEARATLESGYQDDTLREAVRLFTLVLDQSPGLVEALSGRAVAHLRIYHNYYDRSTERLSLAQEDVRLALEADGESAEALFARGYYESIAGTPSKATPYLRRAVQKRPGSAGFLMALGRNESRIGELSSSLRHLREAASLDPRNARLFFELGITEIVANRFREAERSFETAISLSPDLIEAHIYLTQLYAVWLGDIDAASTEARTLQDKIGNVELMNLLLQPGLWTFFTYLDDDFHAQLRSWDVDEAGGDTASWYLAMALAERRVGNGEAADNFYRLAAELREVDVANAPSDPWIATELAWAYAGAGRKQLAIDTVDRVVSLAPAEVDAWNNADFLWVRATVLAMLDMQNEAIEQASAAIQYPSAVTPKVLSLDPGWDRMFDNERFLALMTEDRTQWRRQGEAGGDD